MSVALFYAMRKTVDLSGRTVGRLTVLVPDAAKPGYWKCRCECGTEKSIPYYALLKETTHSCGCLNREALRKKHMKDLTGKVFGRLTVLGRAEEKPRYWICRCSCGKEKLVYSGNLIRGLIKSCGCLNSEATMKRNLIDLTGKIFGKLTVIGMADRDRFKGLPRWVCKCQCGNTVIVTGWNLRKGITESCGCLSKRVIKLKDCVRARITWETEEEKKLVRIFNSMKQRCMHKTVRSYKDYGGRGIYICSEWLENIGTFVKWGLENGFKLDLTIERIDNDGPYAPWNCRWATITEQANNRRTSKYITVYGQKHTLADWARLLKVRYIDFWKKDEQEKIDLIQAYLMSKTA